MIDLAVMVLFEVLLLVVIVGTVREWRATGWDRWLLPVPAFVLAMISCALPYSGDDLARHPWLLGAAWLVVGLVLRAFVQRRYARVQEQEKDAAGPGEQLADGEGG
jgi:hypothetical protein